MMQSSVADQKFNIMTRTPMPKLVSTLAVPSIISMLITSIYNMVDTYFVSRISTSAAGAVGIAFALMAVIQAIGFTVGSGSGITYPGCWGKNRAHASKVAATGFLRPWTGCHTCTFGPYFWNHWFTHWGQPKQLPPMPKAIYGIY